MDQIELAQVPEERKTTAVFLGKDRHRRAAGTNRSLGSFTAMPECRNMASEEYPCAAVRRERVTAYNYNWRYDTDPATGEVTAHEIGKADCLPAALADAVYAGQNIAWLTRSGDVYCGQRYWSDSADSAGRLVPFGRGLYVTGTGVYIPSTEDAAKQKVEVDAKANFPYVYAALTDDNGDLFAVTTVASGAPATPADGDCYYDTTVKGAYRYDAAKTQWLAAPIYHMALPIPQTVPPATNEFKRLRTGDRVLITKGETDEDYIGWTEIAGITAGWIFVRSIADVLTETTTLRVRRIMPVLDFAVAHDNRIWGCRYGENADGEYVNEIYACRLGDPTNWYSFDGTEDASFMASVGEPGPWTGAAVLNDNVVFFKEHCMLTVYGSSPSGYTTQLTYCDGIAAGSDRSAVLINGGLYYHSKRGIMRLYSGSLPAQISDDLSYKAIWRDAIGGTDGRKYYVQMTDTSGTDRLYVYDTQTALWHEETAEPLTAVMLRRKNELLDICSPKAGQDAEKWWVRCVFISGPARDEDAEIRLFLCVKTDDRSVFPYDGYVRPDENTIPALGHTAEGPVKWSFETGDFGHDAPGYKRAKNIAVRAWLGEGAAFDIDIQYDEDGTWEPVVRSQTIRNGRSGTTRVDYRLRRCDLFRLRFRGDGSAVIYSITIVYEGSGDQAYESV